MRRQLSNLEISEHFPKYPGLTKLNGLVRDQLGRWSEEHEDTVQDVLLALWQYESYGGTAMTEDELRKFIKRRIEKNRGGFRRSAKREISFAAEAGQTGLKWATVLADPADETRLVFYNGGRRSLNPGVTRTERVTLLNQIRGDAQRIIMGELIESGAIRDKTKAREFAKIFDDFLLGTIAPGKPILLDSIRRSGRFSISKQEVSGYSSLVRSRLKLRHSYLLKGTQLFRQPRKEDTNENQAPESSVA